MTFRMLGQPTPGQEIPFILNALREISDDSVQEVADGFTLANVTELRALDCATSSLADVRNILGTFLRDLKRRGRYNAA